MQIVTQTNEWSPDSKRYSLLDAHSCSLHKTKTKQLNNSQIHRVKLLKGSIAERENRLELDQDRDSFLVQKADDLISMKRIYHDKI
mmetsp:Transcript_12075/g.13744  ORF Transcript_12075/g.13744 Transcript_12075/m.13744 type:complete len:86 (+) Transcript_12075:406-663(+)